MIADPSRSPRPDVRAVPEGAETVARTPAILKRASSVESPLPAASESDPAELVQRHQAGVWRYLRLLGCDAATADDLTQETFLAVLRRDDFQHINDAATAGYLRTTARNLLISHRRKGARVRLVASLETLDEVWDRWMGAAGDDSDEMLAILKECFEHLTPRAQRALRLRFSDSASRVEIGQSLGITEHGAKNLMQRAKQQLRECVLKKRP